MTNEDRLLKLFQISNDKIQNACDAFEAHFDWLAEQTVESFRRALASEHATLLPKTPHKTSKNTKRPLPPPVTDDEDDTVSQAVKRTSVDSQDGDQDESVMATQPRRGRAASRLAIEKTKKLMEMKNNCKLRRPSNCTHPAMITTTMKKHETTRKVMMKATRSEPEVTVPTDLPTTTTTDLPSSEAKISQGEAQEPKPEHQSEAQLECQSELRLLPSSSNLTPKKQESCTSKRLSVNLSRTRLSDVSLAKSDIKGDTADSDAEDVSLNITQENSSTGRKRSSATRHISESKKESFGNTTKATTISSAGSSVNTTQITVTEAKEKKSETSHLALRLEDSEDEEDIPLSKRLSTKSEKTTDKSYPSASKHIKSRTQTVSPKAQMSDDEDEPEIIQPSPPKPLPRTRITRTKQKQAQEIKTHTNTSKLEDDDSLKEEPAASPVLKARSTRTKQKALPSESIPPATHMLPPVEVPQPKTTCTKVKKTDVSVMSEPDMHTHESKEESVPSNSVPSVEFPKPRSTRTKRKMEESTDKEIMEVAVPIKPRSTRTKKRQVEEETAYTGTKRKKTDEDLVPQSSECTYNKSESSQSNERKGRRSSSQDSVSSSGVSSAKSTVSVISNTSVKVLQATEPAQPVRTRVTRSKMRQVQPIPSPVKASPKSSPRTPTQANFRRGCCTPTNHESPRSPALYNKSRGAKSPAKYSPRPYEKFRSAALNQHTAVGTLNEVEELNTDMLEIPHSPVRVTRHSIGKGNKGEDKMGTGLINKTRSALFSEKTSRVRPLQNLTNTGGNTFGSSGRVTPKTFSRFHPSGIASSTSSEYNSTLKKIGTPTENRRPKNILIGASLTSFIKVQPTKPTKEEIEEKKQQERQRKREKEEETIKKKDGMLKAKAEEKRRMNEERMRRVHEAREGRERKAVEAKEQQERERRQREERQKDEQLRKKQQALAKKRAEEEAKLLKIKEQEEEERRRKEEERRRHQEEERRLEEMKRQEEERRTQLAEQRKLQEEDKKRKAAEMERIAREQREMEKLRQQEAQRKAQAQTQAQKAALNDTYTAEPASGSKAAHNTTYTAEPKTQAAHSNSYEMTPDRTVASKKSNNNNDYNIDDLKYGDVTDDECDPKKTVPSWAKGQQLEHALRSQEFNPPRLDKIFIPEELLMAPNLSQMFQVDRRRFHKRTSSAVWNTPPSKLFQFS